MERKSNLTEEVKAELRSFVWGIVLPTGVALTLVAGVIGFFVNDWARGTAYADAYSDAFTHVFEDISFASKELAKGEITVDEAAQGANVAVAQAKAASKEAQKLEARARQILAALENQVADGNYDGIVEQLLILIQNDPNFFNDAGAAAGALEKAEEITIGGTCFRPRVLFRCYKPTPDGGNHITWLDNGQECTNAGYGIEGQVSFLAQC